MEIYYEDEFNEYLLLDSEYIRLYNKRLDAVRDLSLACERLVTAAAKFGPKRENGTSIYLNELKSDYPLPVLVNDHYYSLDSHTNTLVGIKVEEVCYCTEDYSEFNCYEFPRFLLFMSDVALQVYFEEKAKEYENEI